LPNQFVDNSKLMINALESRASFQKCTKSMEDRSI
jgi:hypothetical protein